MFLLTAFHKSHSNIIGLFSRVRSTFYGTVTLEHARCRIPVIKDHLLYQNGTGLRSLLRGDRDLRQVRNFPIVS